MRLITNDEMEVITSYMNDEIREDVHFKFAPCIIACKTFGDVHEGELGGWIESYENLSQDGYAWVYDNA